MSALDILITHANNRELYQLGYENLPDEAAAELAQLRAAVEAARAVSECKGDISEFGTRLRELDAALERVK